MIAAYLLAFQRPILAVGDRWSPFTMRDAKDQCVQWSPGRVTVFSVCAYWCDTWRLQVPRLVAARAALRGLPVDLCTISTDGRWAEIAQRNGGLPLWRGAGADWSHRVGIDRVPTTVVVDPAGRVTFVRTGVVRESELLPEVRAALKPSAGTGNAVYLTFDDFPPPSGGEALLDALRREGVPATMFCLGSRVAANAPLLRRAEHEGSSLQCHSWDHDAVHPQLDRCREAFAQTLGHSFTLYRAPGSEKIVGWPGKLGIIDPYDYTRPGAPEILRRTLNAARPGCEIQLHAGVTETLDILPELVAKLRARGLQFCTLR